MVKYTYISPMKLPIPRTAAAVKAMRRSTSGLLISAKAETMLFTSCISGEGLAAASSF